MTCASSRASRGRRALLAALAAVCAGAACEQGVEPDTGPFFTTPADARVDSPLVTIDTTATLPAPWATEIIPDVPVIAQPGAVPGEAALPSELAQLGARLAVPVAGVSRSDLRDTYAQARGERVHEAIDILAPRGTPVLSASDGRVLRLFNSKPGGLMVYATDRSERFILLYGHLDGYAEGMRDGMSLRQGQVIGYVGTTGNAAPDTPHLHFAILRGQPAVAWSVGVPVNPYPLLRGGSSDSR
ncbi:MAG TPA: M23 family metallopeptidase [Longimicrobiales bacterium]|nr:M23 family metallopeptidase [Longimicrobiales bacterium]